MKQGLALLEQAVSKDPTYAMAWVQIADAEFSFLAGGMVPQEEGQRRLRAALGKAIEADPKCAEAHGMMAGIIHSQEWDWPRAEAEFKLAIEQGAGAYTRSLYGWSLTTQGRFSEALTQLEMAQDLNPRATGQRMNEAFLFYVQRRYRDAKDVLNGLLREHPDLAGAHVQLAQIAAVEKDCAGIQAQIDWAFRLYPKADLTLDRGIVSACRGDEEPARRYLTKVAAAQPAGPYVLALACAYVHEKDLALSFLEKVAAEKQSKILNIRNEPMFDEIRPDPRFLALEKRVGLQP
jgi:adenylate cyclase